MCGSSPKNEQLDYVSVVQKLERACFRPTLSESARDLNKTSSSNMKTVLRTSITRLSYNRKKKEYRRVKKYSIQNWGDRKTDAKFFDNVISLFSL